MTLPGKLITEPGTRADYDALSRFHYRPGKPATIAAIYRVRFEPRSLYRNARKYDQLAAVGVLSYPVSSVRERNRAFDLYGKTQLEKLHFANQNLRTISRVIVHPAFRAAGVASQLVQHLIARCPTPYVEALATMGWVHPFFERAGMTRVDPEDRAKPVYYWCKSGKPNQ